MIKKVIHRLTLALSLVLGDASSPSVSLISSSSFNGSFFLFLSESICVTLSFALSVAVLKVNFMILEVLTIAPLDNFLSILEVKLSVVLTSFNDVESVVVTLTSSFVVTGMSFMMIFSLGFRVTFPLTVLHISVSPSSLYNVYLPL